MSQNETLWRGDLVIDQSKEENGRYVSGNKVSAIYQIFKTILTEKHKK